MTQTASQSPPRAFHIMTKPIGPICNLDCKYCFYLEKEQLYPGNGRAAQFRMNDATLDQYIHDYIAAQNVPQISFAWQGGEPTLLGVDFFRRVIELQRKHCPPEKTVTNALQTNGTLLDDEWCEFLKEHQFLVGISVDGPRHLHNRYRVTRDGGDTFDDVMRGLNLLKKHGVEFNTLTVVHKELAHEPLEVYHFLKEHGSGFMQFIPLVERAAPPDATLGLASPPTLKVLTPYAPVTPWTVEPLQYGIFLQTIFDEWVRHDVGKYFVQFFDVQLGIAAGAGSSLCVFAETCGSALAMEHNGDLYSCDHYVYPEFKLGNLRDTPLSEMVDSPRQQEFGLAKRDALPDYCRRCEVREHCNGECPKHRFAITPDGESGLNYLCAGYKHVLNHMKPYLKVMADLLAQGRAPAEIMPMLATREGRGPAPQARRPAPQRVQRVQSMPGRNDPCPCGSGQKFKKCCGAGK